MATKQSKFLGIQPSLMPLTWVSEAVYNPRERLPERMEMLRMSLSKLGFILPIYATPNGHLLSGHQRSHVAKELGARHVPVIECDIPEERYKAINLVFNRATNDMSSTETSENLFEKLRAEEIDEIVEAVPDRDPLDHDQFFRALHPEFVPIREITKCVSRPYEAGPVALCKQLLKYGIIMPIVMTKSGKIQNGQYRALAALDYLNDGEEELANYPVIYITDEEARAAEVLLNLVSMKFSVEKQHSNVLRYGAYRAQRSDPNMVQSFFFFAAGCKVESPVKTLADHRKFWHNWRTEHGEYVLDFGAGRRRNRRILIRKGIECVEFEPYPVPWDRETDEKKNKPSLNLSRQMAEGLCDAVASGKRFDSIFLPAVLNSVPFFQDRLKVLAVIHACASFHTKFYGSTRSLEGKKLNPIRPQFSDDGKPMAAGGMFEVPYEDDIVLGDLSNDPKVQKFMSGDELKLMLGLYWKKVEVWENKSAYHYFRCSHPRRVNYKVLAEAILFEFNLPYPDEQHVERAEYALDAFSKKFGVDLRTYLPPGYQETQPKSAVLDVAAE